MYYYLFYSFAIYAFLGWVLEVLFHIYTQKKFVNRGFLHGPVCPIYGSTAVVLIVLLSSHSNNFIYIFFVGALAGSIVEFVTGYLLEMFFKAKWWDYSDEKFNLYGYVCLKFSILWGFLSIVFIKVINPFISQFTYWIISYFGQVLYNVILILLIADIVLTINSLITLKRLFNEIQETIAETRTNMDKLMEKTISGESREIIQQRISHLIDIKERLTRRISLKHKSMLRAYPQITSKKFDAALKEVKEKFIKLNIKK